MITEKLSSEKIDLMRRRQNDIMECIHSLRDIAFGFHTSMDPFFLRHRELDLDCIRKTALDLTALTECTDGEKPFYESFYTASLLYLYAECNADDRIFVSLVKLAGTLSKESPDFSFDKTTFGIMVDMSTENSHRGMDLVAHTHFMETVSGLRDLFQALPALSGLDTTVHAAVREYLLRNGLSPSSSDALQARLMEDLHRARWDLLAMSASR